MKKVLVSSMLILGGLFSACSGFLDEDPKSKIPEEEAYKSEKLVYVNTIATIYTSFGNRLYGSTDNVHTLQEFSSDAWILPGRQGDWVDGGKWQSLFLHNYGPGNATIKSLGMRYIRLSVTVIPRSIIWRPSFKRVGRAICKIINMRLVPCVRFCIIIWSIYSVVYLWLLLRRL